MALNPKQKAFCEEYIIDLNAAQAAIRVGYSSNTAKEQASRLLTDVNVQEYIHKLQKERSKRTEVTADRVLLEIARLAFNDPRKAFSDTGALLPVHEWPDEVAAAISSIKVTEEFDGYGEDRKQIGWTKEVKFWDKGKQIELAGRHLAMFTDNIKHSGNISLETFLEQVDK